MASLLDIAKGSKGTGDGGEREDGTGREGSKRALRSKKHQKDNDHQSKRAKHGKDVEQELEHEGKDDEKHHEEDGDGGQHEQGEVDVEEELEELLEMEGGSAVEDGHEDEEDEDEEQEDSSLVKALSKLVQRFHRKPAKREPTSSEAGTGASHDGACWVLDANAESMDEAAKASALSKIGVLRGAKPLEQLQHYAMLLHVAEQAPSGDQAISELVLRNVNALRQLTTEDMLRALAKQPQRYVDLCWFNAATVKGLHLAQQIAAGNLAFKDVCKVNKLTVTTFKGKIEEWTDSMLRYVGLMQLLYAPLAVSLLGHVRTVRALPVHHEDPSSTAWIIYDTNKRLALSQGPLQAHWELADFCTATWERARQEDAAARRHPASDIARSGGGQRGDGGARANGRPNPNARGGQRRDDAFCRDFNNSRCSRSPCRYFHRCSCCGGSHPRTSCTGRKGSGEDDGPKGKSGDKQDKS